MTWGRGGIDQVDPPLRAALTVFARQLAAEQHAHYAYTEADEAEQRIDAAIAGCKASIGRALLEILESLVKP